jgi:hypothetical protein
MGIFVKAVWAAYPDASPELSSKGDTGGRSIATQWVFHGTNTSTLSDCAPATDRIVAMRGAAFAQFAGVKTRSEGRDVDIDNMFEQLRFKAK